MGFRRTKSGVLHPFVMRRKETREEQRRRWITFVNAWKHKQTEDGFFPNISEQFQIRANSHDTPNKQCV